jgi:DNA-binding NarL/FixJ family response regulator
MSIPQTLIRILLVDDHTLFRESLKRVLEADPRFKVVSEASTLEQATAYCNSGNAFDLGLIDFQLSTSDPAKNGLAVLQVIRATNPAAAIILLTAGTGKPELREAVQSHSASVFLKSEPASDLFFAIDRTLQGKRWVSSGANELLLEESSMPFAPASGEASFTTRELAVLRWITEGLSNKEIASQLSVSESSVKALLQKLFEKTSVRTRSQLVRYVFECGLTLP